MTTGDFLWTTGRATGDLPSISGYGHSHSTYTMDAANSQPLYVHSTSTAPPPFLTTADNASSSSYNQLYCGNANQSPSVASKKEADKLAQIKKRKDDVMPLRYVQVLIADTDENLPLDRRVIYKGEQKITDLNDQELFFEIDIKKMLDEHNAYRVTLINKEIKERTENLEPVKIRDLKMVVTTIAEFK